MQGVSDSDKFLLVLTADVLGRPFCQREILEAIKLKKQIHILIERDSRFSPFPLKVWEAWERSKRKSVMKFKHRDEEWTSQNRELTVSMEMYHDFMDNLNRLPAIKSQDMGKEVSIASDTLRVHGVERPVWWGSEKHHDCTGVISSVVESLNGTVQLEDGQTFENPASPSLAKWKEAEKYYVFKDASGKEMFIPATICDRIDECLRDAVSFSRRDFEYVHACIRMCVVQCGAV